LETHSTRLQFWTESILDYRTWRNPCKCRASEPSRLAQPLIQEHAARFDWVQLTAKPATACEGDSSPPSCIYSVTAGRGAGFRDFLRLPSAKENRSNRRTLPGFQIITRLTSRSKRGEEIKGRPRAGFFLVCGVATNSDCRSSDIAWRRCCELFSVICFLSWRFA